MAKLKNYNSKSADGAKKNTHWFTKLLIVLGAFSLITFALDIIMFIFTLSSI